uniref:Endonuclease/exonuclease/phosphatase domain-containing protein n=1 Tax=Aegilops tauschii subsp. strangulata TaxID=200361 RepID=A0A453F8Q5_AEGTS
VACFLGGYRLKGFAQRPAVGTRGGILLLWDEDHVCFENVHHGDFTLSAQITIISSNTSFKFTTVYGPTRNNLKDVFFQELKDEKPPLGERWLVAGDFNQIYRARDKNRSNANRSRITHFRNALNFCELKEIHLQNRRFTWSNEQNNPTMSKLDGFFCNEDWDITFDKHILHALSSSLSDHCPLLLANDDGPRRPRSFRFENFWTNMPGFQQVILEAWNKPPQHHDPFLRLFHKLKKTSQKLRVWSRTLFSNAKVQLHMALEIILRLDEAQDVRILSPEEADL